MPGLALLCAEHQQAGLGLRLRRKSSVRGHLVAVEVRGERDADGGWIWIIASTSTSSSSGYRDGEASTRSFNAPGALDDLIFCVGQQLRDHRPSLWRSDVLRVAEIIELLTNSEGREAISSATTLI